MTYFNSPLLWLLLGRNPENFGNHGLAEFDSLCYLTNAGPISALSQHHSRQSKVKAGDDKQYTCPVCNRNFVRYSSLRNHRVYECEKEADLHCPYCRYSTKIKGNLKRHIIIKHGNFPNQL